MSALATIAATELRNYSELVQFLNLNSQRLAGAVETSLHLRVVDETAVLHSLITFTQDVSVGCLSRDSYMCLSLVTAVCTFTCTSTRT